jgi:leader peptidase (prepilin peptidase) / N-methyltransferase
MLNLLMNVPVIMWTMWAFLLGSCVGSMLNVCIARLPLEKSILWPNSRCGRCLQAIKWYDNIPLVSYWLLRGRCRACGATFSVRYFLVELLTGLTFAGLFLLEIVGNVHDLPFFFQQAFNVRNGLPPWQAWAFLIHHAALVSLLIVAAACDLDRREIPLSLTLFGTGLGLVGATLFPWPWPGAVAQPGFVPAPPWWLAEPADLGRGLYPWPFWGPLPDWLPLGSHRAGFATGLVGALVGTWLLRAIRVIFTKGLGREALGLGDADLMMMAGAFLGWQPVVVAFFGGAMVTLVFAVVQMIVYRDNSLPFGPGLAVGVVLTMLGWRWIGPAVQPLLFNMELLLLLIGAGAGLMFLLSAVFRVIRGPQEPEA